MARPNGRRSLSQPVNETKLRNKKLPAALREVLMSADCPVLETLYQKAQSKQDQPDKSKPKCVGRKEGERANLTEQASQAKRHGNPKGD